MKTPTGGTFTEAEARILQPNVWVYLPVNYKTGSGKPVTSKPDNIPTPSTGNFDISKITQTVPHNIRSYAEESIPRILAAAAGAGITDLGQLAYILATSEHESVAGKYMEELASGDAYEGRLDLGNTQPGDGRRYKGRGYVQITGRTNYTNWAKRLGVDLVGNPVLAATPAIAAQILVEGMRDGSFTGVGLSRYINGSNRDFYNARRIVNGTNVASKIAEIAERYYNALVNAIQQNTSPSKNVILRPGSQNLKFSRGKEWITESGFRFTFQRDGNVVLYNPQGKAVWATGTNGTNADKFVVQADGNVVLYDRGKPIWATNTSGNSGTYFAIQGDGNLVVYSSDGKPLYDSATHSGRTGTFSASAEWIRDINLRRFPNLQFTTVTSKATSKALDAGGGNSSVYPHPSPNADNTYHQWGFEKVGDHYMIINKATGKVLDAGGANGTLPYLNSYPDTQNPYQLWKLTQVGDAYLVVNKTTGRTLDSGGANGSQIYMHPNPMSENSFHLWALDLPQTNTGWQNPLDASTYTIFPGGEYGARGGAHYGIDLSTWHSNPYVPVKAAQSGKVIEVGDHPTGWGNFIKIRHGNEFQTVYAHLSQVDVAEGQTVSGGQKIGNVGSTGNSSGPHLHFETYVAPFRWPTDTRNPRNYIKF
jgi:murein DD-endopeptidase MepM/ murein hydrolase activator NlpD